MLLRGQWREAVRLLLTPRADCGRPDQTEACRLYLEKGDVEGALRKMPRFLVTEPALLQVGWRVGAGVGGRMRGLVGRRCQHGLWPGLPMALAYSQQPTQCCLLPASSCATALPPHPLQALQRQPNDHLGALMSLPRNLRTMYIHAYQSYLVGGWVGGWVE